MPPLFYEVQFLLIHFTELHLLLYGTGIRAYLGV